MRVDVSGPAATGYSGVSGPKTKGGAMYIGGGVLALIVIIVLLIWLL